MMERDVDAVKESALAQQAETGPIASMLALNPA
jgi:hypothetical protein